MRVVKGLSLRTVWPVSTLSVLLLLACSPAGAETYLSPASTRTIWSVAADHRTIEVSIDGGPPTPFVVKGVGYSPRPIGDGAAGLPGSDYFWGDPANLTYGPIWFRDLWGATYNRPGLTRPEGILRQLGANSIRTYAWWKWVPTDESVYAQWRTLDWDVGPPVRLGDSRAPRGFAPAPAHDGGDQFLDLCWNHGVDPIYVVIGISIDPWMAFPSANPGWTSWRDNQAFIRRTTQWLARRYGYHPAVMGFVISNETNLRGPAGTDRYMDYWNYLNSLGAEIKRYAPSKLTMTAFADYPWGRGLLLSTPLVQFRDWRNPKAGAATVAVCVNKDGSNLGIDCHSAGRRPAYPADVYQLDVWGFNTYCNPESGNLASFSELAVEGRYTNGNKPGPNANNPRPKPILWTEWGAPASRRTREGTPPPPPNSSWVEDDPGVPGRFNGAPGYHAARVIEQLAQDMYRPARGLSTISGGLLSGGYLFEYSDEWWKEDETNRLTWSSHDTSLRKKKSVWGEQPSQFQAYWDEEWFGLLAASPDPSRRPLCEPAGDIPEGSCSGKIVGSGPGSPDDPVIIHAEGGDRLNGGPDVLSKRAGFYALREAFAGLRVTSKPATQRGDTASARSSKSAAKR